MDTEAFFEGNDPNAVRDTAAERMSWLDYVLALSVGVFVAVLLFVWSFPGMDITCQEDVAVAAGLRPAATLCPGVWRALAAALFRSVGLTSGLGVLKFLAPLTVGATSALVYLLFRQILVLSSRLRLQYSPWRSLIVRLSSVLGAACFGFSDPVWKAGQFFEPVTLLLFLSVFGAYLFFSFLVNGRLFAAYVAMFVLGVLSAETPTGFLFMVFCWGVYFLAARKVLSFNMPLLNPFVEQVSKWHMTFLYIAGVAAGCAVNVSSFTLAGGEAAALAGGDLPVKYLQDVGTLVMTAASPLGWLLGIVLALLPCGIAAGLLPRAVDEEQFLPYHVGSLYLVTGFVALAQLSGFAPMWFWTWGMPEPMFGSSFLLCLMMLATAASFAFSLVVLGVDVFCRNHRRLAIQMYAEMEVDGKGEQVFVSKGFQAVVGKIGLVALPLLIAAVVVPARRLEAPRAMAGALHEYVAQVAAACADVSALFSDGVLDAAVELASARAGHPLSTVSFFSGETPRDGALRRRAARDGEDAIALDVGAAATVRTWIRDKPARLKEAAFQLGEELWARDGKPLPELDGVVLRAPGAVPAEKRAAAYARMTALAERLLKLEGSDDGVRAAGAAFNRLYLLVRWRLAQLLRVQARAADVANDLATAEKATRLASRLDASNPAVVRLREQLTRQRTLLQRHMTPREGLQLALVRADFAQARTYAERLLEIAPADADAHFALGMDAFLKKAWTQAAAHLKAAHAATPDEPAILNNLALVALETGDLDAAAAYARKALERAPDSTDVRDTAQRVVDARKKGK